MTPQTPARYPHTTPAAQTAEDETDAAILRAKAAQRGGEAVDREALAAQVLDALDAYDAECEAERRRLSIETWGHGGAHVGEASPTREGRVAAVAAVLAARGDAAPTVSAERVREAVEASGQSEPMIRTLLAVLGIGVR